MTVSCMENTTHLACEISLLFISESNFIRITECHNSEQFKFTQIVSLHVILELTTPIGRKLYFDMSYLKVGNSFCIFSKNLDKKILFRFFFLLLYII